MQPRAEQTRQALITAAAELFDSRGLRATGLLDISRGAKVSKGALYFHFGSKDDLATAVWWEAHTRIHALADKHLGCPAPTLATVSRFMTDLAAELRRDVVLRAGIRLESEGGLDRERTGPTLREEWLDFLSRHLTERYGGPSMPNLLVAVTTGLEALGRADASWWSEETVDGIWELLLTLSSRQER